MSNGNEELVYRAVSPMALMKQQPTESLNEMTDFAKYASINLMRQPTPSCPIRQPG